MHMIRQIAVAGAFMLAAVLGTGTMAQAQQYPPSAPGCSLSVTIGPAGTTTVVTCTPGSFAGGVTVTVTFTSAPVQIGSGTSAADGSFTKSVTVPSDATPGAHTITASGTGPTGAAASYPMAFTVTTPIAENEPVNGQPLPRTGSSSTIPWTRAGVALLLVGGALVFIGRRRHLRRSLSR
jgi:LPXTG-motif cell wall-anchored protein